MARCTVSGTGTPWRVAGSNLRVAFSSKPNPAPRVTSIFCGTPSELMTALQSTSAFTPARRASSVYSGSSFESKRGSTSGRGVSCAAAFWVFDWGGCPCSAASLAFIAHWSFGEILRIKVSSASSAVQSF